MYPHQRGWRQFPGLVEFASVAGISPAGLSKDLTASTGMGAYSSMRMKPDGSEVYVMDIDAGAIDQWTLSSADDISSASYTGTISLSGTGTVTNPVLVGIKSDGTSILWAASDGSDVLYLYKWTMSTPWDITTATSTQTKAFGLPNEAAWIGDVKSDGTRLYGGPVASGQLDDIYTYTMTAWDISTLAITADSYSFGQNAQNIAFREDLSRAYIMSGGAIYQIKFSTPGTLSTGSELGIFQDANLLYGGVEVFDGDTKLLAGHNTTDIVYQYNIVSGDSGRGAINMNGTLYVVVDGYLFSVSSSGNTTGIGTIAGTERVVVDTDGTQLVTSTGSSGSTSYVYTTSGGLGAITDADFVDTAKSNAYLDLAFYFDQGSTGNFIASDNNDATAFDTDDRAEAESFADAILRVYAHNQLLYLFGSVSTEIWYTSGAGRPPIERQQVIERGIVGTHAIASIDDRIFFVDQFRRPNVMSGFEYQPIYSPAIAEEWDTYTTDSDCIVTAYSYRQQTFVDFIFPTDDAYWTYHVDSGAWCEREDSSNNRYRPVEYVNVYDKVLCLDRSNGKIYELSETTCQDDGSSITRTKDIGPVTSEIFGDAAAFGDEMICNSLKLTLESTGAGSITVSLLKDGGSFGQSRTINVTAGVQTRELNRWGKFREAIFRVTTTSNIGLDIIDAAADLEVLNG